MSDLAKRYSLVAWHEALGKHPALGITDFDWTDTHGLGDIVAPRFVRGVVGITRVPEVERPCMWCVHTATMLTKAGVMQFGWQLTPPSRHWDAVADVDVGQIRQRAAVRTTWILVTGANPRTGETTTRSPEEIVAELAKLVLTPYPYQE